MKCDYTPESEIPYTNKFMQMGAMQGWQCPQCGRIYAPFVQECYHCNSFESTLTTTTTEGTNPITLDMQYNNKYFNTSEVSHCCCASTRTPKHMKED